MLPSLNLDLPEPAWLGLLRAEHAKGKPIAQIARECGMARTSVSGLLSGNYPAQSLDLVERKHGARILEVFCAQTFCPHLRRGLEKAECEAFAAAPMSTSNPDRLQHWRACRRCPLNPFTRKEN